MQSEAAQLCDRHGSWLVGENPVMALRRREHVGEPQHMTDHGRISSNNREVWCRNLSEV
jgi:hypothetical protein